LINYKGDGVKPGMSAPDEKEMKDPEQHAMGAGTEQAGTGDDEGEVPSRKDRADQMVKSKKYTDEGTPIKVMAGAGGEGDDEDYMEEAFKLFEEEIEGDDDIDVDSDDMMA
jgi:hypothetical protein